MVSAEMLGLVANIVGTALFACVFAFLHQESRATYFGYWALAWGLLGAAGTCDLAEKVTSQAIFLLPFTILNLAFVASLLFAAASVSGSSFNLRLTSVLLVIGALFGFGYVVGLFRDRQGFHAVMSLVLAVAYGWNLLVFRRAWEPAGGTGRKLFSGALLMTSLLHLQDGIQQGVLSVARGFSGEQELSVLVRFHQFPKLVVETILAFAALMMWMEKQQEQLERANVELTESRQEMSRRARTDSLTGLLNRSALNEACEALKPLTGMVALLDVDNFKQINDTRGHAVGDEVLANIGGLIRSSVRREDEAWRWGGDEFVILFRDQTREAVEERIRQLNRRLEDFRLRGNGLLPVRLSWGVADLQHRSIQQAIEEADGQMYRRKRDKDS